jgi:hypothetical protein
VISFPALYQQMTQLLLLASNGLPCRGRRKTIEKRLDNRWNKSKLEADSEPTIRQTI